MAGGLLDAWNIHPGFSKPIVQQSNRPIVHNNMKKTTEIILATFLIGIILLLATLIASSVIIGNSVQEKCEEAREKYNGDCVEALIIQLDNEEEDFKARNRSIWALGQMGDEKALPTLKKYYTGDIPEREKIDEVISQYELKKAIKLINSGFNITAIFWR